MRSFTTFKTQEKIPFVSFVDDDTSLDVMTKIYPIFTSKNVPCNLAVISSMIDTNRKIMPEASGSMSTEDLELVMSIGWELLGHSDQHNPNLLVYETDESLDDDLKTNKLFLENIQSFKTGFVYPQSAHNLKIRDNVRKYFEFSFAGTGFNEEILINPMEIKRIAFGYSHTQNPTEVNGIPEADTLEYYKACIDYAITHKLWVVFMLHCWDSHFNGQMLSDLIDYIKLTNVKIGTVTDGYEIFGPNFFVGDIASEYSAVSKKGVFTNSGAGKIILNDNSKKPTDGVNEFPMGVSVCKIGNTESAEWNYPEKIAGVLTTYRYNKDYYYNRQEYAIYLYTPLKFTRFATSLNTWSDWTIDTTTIHRHNVNLETDSPSTYLNKIRYIDTFTNEHAENQVYPNNQGGTIITERYNDKFDNYYGWQIFYTYDNKIYQRYQTEWNLWSDWSGNLNLSRITGTLEGIHFDTDARSYSEQTFIVLGANPEKSINVFPKNNYPNVWPVGLIWQGQSLDNDSITIRVYNVTDLPIVDSIKNWGYIIE